ncbi:MAG: histidinol-phosphate transaminase [Treponema sp.]|nr:histidinol-phosphate transaminase [Treponema sp.]
MITSSRMSALHPYVPGEQPKDRVYTKLNANENPYAPSPKVIKAVTDFITANPQKLALYPDPDSNELHAKIADMINKTGGVLCRAHVAPDGSVTPDESDRIPFTVTPDMIYTGNGSDEVLSFVFYAFFDSGKKFVMPQFTYSFYPVYAGFYDIPMDQVPLNEDWTLNTEEMLVRVKNNGGGMIFANPNAPTSLALTREQVRQMLLKANPDKIFIVDEAYVDFGGESCIPLLKEFSNLLIVRTFSKSLCAAGMRLGYVVASPELINTITTVKNSVNHFPLDAVAQVAGCTACENPDYYAECARKVAQERDKFYNFLKSRGFYVLESKTNFLFARHPSIGGEELYRRVKEKGFLIRHFATPGIEEFVRITVGTAEQMEGLKKVFEEII